MAESILEPLGVRGPARDGRIAGVETIIREILEDAAEAAFKETMKSGVPSRVRDEVRYLADRFAGKRT